jgi:hypothetical protein
VIDLDGLYTLLETVKHATPVRLTTYTLVDNMNKTVDGTRNPYFKRVWKRAMTQGMIYWWYDRSVNRQRLREDKEPDFVALPHHYHIWIPRTPMSHHKDDSTRLYLPTKIQNVMQYAYEIDGVVQDNPEVIESWMRPESPTRQGVDDVVIYRQFKLESITDIAINNEWIEIDHPQGVRIPA